MPEVLNTHEQTEHIAQQATPEVKKAEPQLEDLKTVMEMPNEALSNKAKEIIEDKESREQIDSISQIEQGHAKGLISGQTREGYEKAKQDALGQAIYESRQW